MADNSKPKIGIYGLTGCAGDQLQILNCEAELLEIVSRVDIRSFIMASSMHLDNENIDVALVEGAVCQPDDLNALVNIRKRAKILVALGTCASWGGISAMDQRTDREKLIKDVYGKGVAEDVIPTVISQPLKSFVHVDYEIYGCPIEKHQFIGLLSSLLRGEFPEFPKIPVCTECRLKENPCLIIEKSVVCCGPLTNAGCNARCPSYGRPCDGCRGPVEEAYFKTTTNLYKSHGINRKDIQERLKFFSAPAGMGEKILKEF